MNVPILSVVIPVYNEEDSLQMLFDRLYPALDVLAKSYEIIFVNDGSRDRSAAMLTQQHKLRADVTSKTTLSDIWPNKREYLPASTLRA
jgi:undecaprenyl-phosphate 4-deoxy-4-formamido-L-arabinose transferase